VKGSEETTKELKRKLSRFYDYGRAAKVKHRVYGLRNGLLYRLLDFLTGFFLGFAFVFAAAVDDALLRPHAGLAIPPS